MSKMSDNSKEDGHLEGFSKVMEILDGSSSADFKDGEAKLLCFMLRERSECDLEITPKKFTIRYSWHPSNHPYFPELAAGVVAQLMSWAQLQSVDVEHVCQFGPAESGTGAYYCSFGERWVWFHREDDAVKIAIRGNGPDADAAFCLPDPIVREVDEPVYATFSSPVFCPHCKQGAAKLRELTDAFVCPNCSRSFDKERESEREA